LGQRRRQLFDQRRRLPARLPPASLSHQDVLPHLDQSAQVGLELALGEALVPAPAHHVRRKIPDPLDERRVEDGYGSRRVNGFSQPATCSLRFGRPSDYGSPDRPAPSPPPPTQPASRRLRPVGCRDPPRPLPPGGT